MRIDKMWLLSMILFVLSGCASVSTLHTATPVEKEEVEANVVPGVYGVSFEDGTSASTLQSEVAVRAGVSEHADVGGKLFSGGFAVDFNWAPVNMRHFALALNPYYSTFFADLPTGKSAYAYSLLMTNVLADVIKTDSLTVTVGAKPGYAFIARSGDDDKIDLDEAYTDPTFFMGGMAGVKVSVSERFALMPSVDVISFPSSDGYLYQGSVGLMF